jgi:hypothetical protein
MGRQTTGRRGRPIDKQPDRPRLPVHPLALWRAQREGDLVAVAVWKRYTACAEELVALGMPCVEALDVAAAEL